MSTQHTRRTLIAGVTAVVLVCCAGCGVSTQDHPEKLAPVSWVPDPAPSVTQVPDPSTPPPGGR